MKTRIQQWLSQIVLSLKNKTNALSLYEKLSLIISSLGVLSLIFIVVQVIQTTTNMKASMYATMTSHTLEMDKIFLEYPLTRPYFYDDRDLSELKNENEDTRHRVMIVAEYQLDYFDLLMTQLDYIPTDEDSEEDKANWNKYIADSFAHSPALCKRINLNPDWYMTELVKISKENCKNPG